MQAISSNTDTEGRLQRLSQRNDDRKRSRQAGLLQFIGGLLSIFKPDTDSPTTSLGTVDFGPEEEVVTLSRHQIARLTPSCQQIVAIIDAVSEVHGFIRAPAQAIKLPLVMLSKLSANDQKIGKLIDVMANLFVVVDCLQSVSSARVQKHARMKKILEERMNLIHKDVRGCIAACDTYIEKNTVVRLLLCIPWETELGGYIDTFNEHGRELHHTIGQLTVINTAAIMETVDLLALRSSKEDALLNYIREQGGPSEICRDEKKMTDLLRKGQTFGLAVQGHLGGREQKRIVKEIMNEASKPFADMINESQVQFARKLVAQRNMLKEEFEKIATREGDRIIRDITAGPHEKIFDPDMYIIWKDMGWRMTIDARSFVMALREYYAEWYQDRKHSVMRWAPEVRNLVTSESEKRAKPKGIAHEDLWTLEYITISRIQPLLEAFDSDASGLISVSEVNTLTNARPVGWSLPRWIAYWTAGFPLLTQHYFGLTQLLLGRLPIIIADVHPVNRHIVDYFMTHWSTYGMDQMLAGTYESIDEVEGDTALFERFKSYIHSEERRLNDALATVGFRIDAENTLFMVIDNDRIEKHVMTLVYLIFLRFYRVVEYGKTAPLHPITITNLTDSLETIFRTLGGRLRNIKALHKFQNVPLKDQLSKFGLGLYYFLEYPDESWASPYYSFAYFSRSRYTLNIFGMDFLSNHIRSANLHSYTAATFVEHHKDTQPMEPSEIDLAPGVCIDPETYTHEGTFWSVFSGEQWERGEAATAIGLLQFYLPSDSLDLKSVAASSFDDEGDFSVQIPRSGTGRDTVVFTKVYPAGQTRYYWGTVDYKTGHCSGSWGYSADIEEASGQFRCTIAPLSFPFVWRKQDAYSRAPDALWRYALRSIRCAIRVLSRSGPTLPLIWDHLQQRRHLRRSFLANSMRQHDFSSDLSETPWADADEGNSNISELTSQWTPGEYAFYRQLSVTLNRRRVVFWDQVCDECGKFPMVDTELECLDCSHFNPNEDVPDNWGVCLGCESDHDPTHRLLQLRSFDGMRGRYGVAERAADFCRSLLEDRRTAHCYRCDVEVLHQYWSCIDCDGETSICVPCKAVIDEMYSPIFDLWTHGEVDDPVSEQNSVSGPHGEETGTNYRKASKLWGHPFEHTLLLIPAMPIVAEQAETSATLADAIRRLERVEIAVNNLSLLFQRHANPQRR